MLGVEYIRLTIYSIVLMTFEEGARPLEIRMGRIANLQVMSCEVKKMYLKRNIQFGMRDTK